MRKFILFGSTVVLVLLNSSKNFAQRLSVQTSFGYSIGTGITDLGGNYSLFHPNSQGFALETDPNVGPGSFGSGYDLDFTIGYSVNEFLSCGLEFTYHHSGFFGWDSSDKNYRLSNSWQANIIRLTPFIKRDFGTQSLNPFLMIGPVLKIGGSINEYYLYVHQRPLDAWQLETQFFGGISFGVMFGGGLEYHLYKSLTFVLYAKYIYQTWAPKHSEQIDVNDKNYLFKVDFVDNVAPYISTNNPQSTKAPTYNNPFSGVSINMGLKFSIGKMAADTK